MGQQMDGVIFFHLMHLIVMEIKDSISFSLGTWECSNAACFGIQHWIVFILQKEHSTKFENTWTTIKLIWFFTLEIFHVLNFSFHLLLHTSKIHSKKKKKRFRRNVCSMGTSKLLIEYYLLIGNFIFGTSF